jgi:exosortase E/protease (VPEID-CTERM system)
VGLIASGLMSFAPDVGDFIWNGPFWRISADLVFTTVKALLSVALPHVIADRSTMTLGSPQFLVTIMAGCSGWEGTALMLVFSSSWLCFLRNDFRFPQALLLIPTAMVFMWICNAVRITVLILIGAAGAADIALDGFHSEAGWIAFNGVALGFAIWAGKLSWFALQTPEKRGSADFFTSPTVSHLLPFLSMLAAGMISRALAAGFEWFYPLRLILVTAVLWRFRRSYAQLDWHFSRLAAVVGGIICLIWLALAHFTPAPPPGPAAATLARIPSLFRIAWVLCRIIAGIITVPFAEELAFRGFLIRGLLSRDFDGLSPRAYTWWSVLISSLAFGVLHGGQWLAGFIAGVLYAAIYLRRGRIGDAVLAHATTNGLLAAWVLWTGDWSLW